ncbi:MAG TPA: alpha-(1-_3)-arabinofuranosyltransferase family protein [Thermoleophilaceae bacterium]|nr:alpha-(1->3)-arabinofuranosyltransferase family protein [Thermoleophilaceae bacterium]
MSRRLLSPALAALAFAIALLQRPGEAVADTKIDLHVDPVGFLADVASVWSDSGGLGQVQSGQYSGYLFPMGPFFALGDLLGLPPWLIQRLWLGLLLALAAWGTVRLLDALLPRERGAAHLVAGLLVLLNPYVVVFANRTSVTLLGYAALPWLLLIVQRGVRDPRRLWWAAAFALVLASTGGGVNAAVTGWILLAPILLAAYEAAFGPVRWRDVGAFAVRAAPLAVLASLWWIVPVAAHARYGLNFLPFTEAPGSIWDTTSLSEGFRLLGYWIGYLGVGYGGTLTPYFDTAPTYLFDIPVIVATFSVPALVIAGLALSLRWRYGPFFLALLLLGLLITAAGFPDGAPLRRALTFTYYRLEAVQFLRTSYKATPLAALALACLGGVAAGEAWRRLRARPAALRAALAVGAAVLVGLTALPLLEGRGVDEQVTYDVPRAWELAADDLDRELPPGSRALVLPGQVFPFYEWGGTQDSILPALSDRPVTTRYIEPHSDLHAVDMLFTVDGLVQQRRVVPGQLGPLLHLLGVRALVTAADDDRALSGSVDPRAAEAQLASDPALGEAERRYGRFGSLPRVRRYDLPAARPLVRIEPSGPGLVVDGSAEALAGLAAFGALPRSGPILYAGDAEQAAVERAAVGGEVVVSDSNRRRVFLSSRPTQNVGATLGPDDPISKDGAQLNPFGERGTDGQTVTLLDGADWIRAPFSPQFAQFPEHRPYTAFDGDADTFWIADRNLDVDRRRIEIAFERPRDVPYIDVLPRRESSTGVTSLEVGGRTFEIEPGWNRLPVELADVERLELAIGGLSGGSEEFRGPGALAEVRIPGLEVSESLRTPRLAETALEGRDLSRTGLSYLFARTTGDNPYRRAPELNPDRGFVEDGPRDVAALASEPGDGERQIRRSIDPPEARRYEPQAWVSVASDAPDELIDELLGLPAGFRSSGRHEGLPGRRASSAFDGDPGTAWIAPSAGGPPWIEWETERPVSLSRLRLTAVRAPGVGAPARVRVRSAGKVSPALEVADGGLVTLPGPLRGRRFRLELLEGDRAGAPALGIAELDAPGVAAYEPRGGGSFRSPCGALRLSASSGARADLRVDGAVRRLDAGRPLRATACGDALELPAGRTVVETRSRLFLPSLVRLRSPAPDGAPVPVTGGGSVIDRGARGHGSYKDVRVEVEGPSWLVLGESFNLGWTASCDGDDLGDPRPIDGFANGWRVEQGCERVEIVFGPNRVAIWSYVLSGLACLVLLVLLALRRPPRRAEEERPAVLPALPAVRRLPLGRAAAIGLAAGLVGGFLFALRAGVVIGPLVALLLWRGPSIPQLTAAAAALVGLVVPTLYLILMPDDLGGFNSEYPADLISAHWVAVGAFVLLALALVWAVLSTAKGRSGDQAAAPAGAASARSRP